MDIVMARICPIMSAGWLANKWAAIKGGVKNTSTLENLVECKGKVCMAFKDDECELCNKPIPTIKSKDIGAKKC